MSAMFWLGQQAPKLPAKHTPGPWRACHDAECSCFLVTSSHHPIAEVINGNWGDEWPAVRVVDDKAEAYMERMDYGSVGDETARANWRLIAAAPDLLAVLQEIVRKWGFPNTPDWHRAADAIAKATGRKPGDPA